MSYDGIVTRKIVNELREKLLGVRFKGLVNLLRTILFSMFIPWVKITNC